MPSKNKLEDFKVGDWVGFSEERIADNAYFAGQVVQVKEVGGEYVTVSYVTRAGVKISGGFWPSSLLTPKEMEDTLYHCSFCGVSGHNRRTCPELGGISMKLDGEIAFSRGKELPWTEIKSGDKIMVTGGASAVTDFSVGLYEVLTVYPHDRISVRVLDNGGNKDIGPFGKNWNFILASSWTFYEADTIEGEKSKLLPLWDLIDIVLPATRLILLYGPPGTGKTTAGNFLGNPKEVYNLTLTEETPAAELRGHFIPKGHEFVWMDGPALTAFKKGARLVLNEIDKASGDALTFCHALLDDPGIAKITLPYKDENGDQVIVSPTDGFHVVATMNGEPEDLPEALRDRFAVRIHVDKVNPNAIKMLPKDLQKIATKGVSNDGDRSVSIRGWNAFVQLREKIGEENAARAVFGPRAKTILNLIKIDGITGAKKS